jgi:hypothetical protein
MALAMKRSRSMRTAMIYYYPNHVVYTPPQLCAQQSKIFFWFCCASTAMSPVFQDQEKHHLQLPLVKSSSPGFLGYARRKD